MPNKPKKKRENRSLTVDFENKNNYFELIKDGKAFLEFVIVFIQMIGFQLKHKVGCSGGFELTRHSSYERIRLNGLIIWRIQCKDCKAVFTILPQFVLRYSSVKPEVAEKALTATYNGMSLEVSHIVCDVPPMALYRLICTLGNLCIVYLLVRCGLTLPKYLLVDEKHSHLRLARIYLATIATGRVLWLLKYMKNKSEKTFNASYGEFKEAALAIDPSYNVDGILTDGYDTTVKSMRRLFPGAKIGNCLMHAYQKVGKKLKGIPSKLRKSFSQKLYGLFQKCKKRRSLKIFSLGQRLRRFAEKVKKETGTKNGKSIGEWIQRKKAGWYTVLEDPQMPQTLTMLDQAHNTIDRKLFMMKYFHHPNGSQAEFVNGLAVLYNFVPYQKRAKNAGKCGVEVEGGKLPLPGKSWLLNLQILSSGGFQ